MIPQHRTEPGSASLPLCWECGGFGDVVALWQWAQGEGQSLGAILSLYPGLGGVGGPGTVEGTRGDMPKSSAVPPWCYRGQPGADGMCPLGKGAVATMLRDSPGAAPWRGEHSWSWAYPWHPKNLQGGSGRALVRCQPWLSPVREGWQWLPAPHKLYFHIVFDKSIKFLLFLFLCSPGRLLRAGLCVGGRGWDGTGGQSLVGTWPLSLLCILGEKMG